LQAGPEFELLSYPMQDCTRFSEEQQDELATLSGLYESASAFLGEIAEGHDSASKVRC
jgi:hypothetical protein